MKFVPFAKHGPIESRAFLLQMLLQSPAGQTIGQMREKQKVVDVLEAAGPEGAVLEDAQHAALLATLNGRSDFIVTSKDIIAIVDSVAEAKAPPAIVDTPKTKKTKSEAPAE